MTPRSTLLRRLTAAASAASFAALLAAAPLTAQAAPMMKSHGGMVHGQMSHTMMHGKMVYACAKCKMYYSPAKAKSMHYKDSMGHKLMKMSKAPMGYQDGGMMHGKM